MAELVDDLIEGSNITLQQILNNLLDADKNLELKTHVHKPKQLTSLYTIAKYLKSLELPISSLIIKEFLIKYLKLMISYKRLSRTEIIHAFTAVNQQDKNKESELLSNLSE